MAAAAPVTSLKAKTSTVLSRAATSTTFADTDGTQTVELSQSAINYQDTSGRWQAIDNSVVPDPDRAGGFSNAANSWRVHFGTSTQGVAVDTAAGSVSVVPVGVTAGIVPVKSSTGDGVVYANAWPGADLTYTVTGDSVKETVVLTSAAAASSFSFTIRSGSKQDVLAGTAALVPSLAALPTTGGSSGGLAGPGALAGLVHFDAPVVLDSAGAPVAAAAPSLVSGANLVVLSVNAAWLAAQPAASFPIRLDPTIGVAQANEWSYESTGYSCANCAHGVQFGNSRSSGDTYWRSLASYNTSSIAGTQVLYAEIDFAYVTGTTNADPMGVYSPNNYTYAGAIGGGQIASGNPEGGVVASGAGLTSFLQGTANANSATAVLGFAGSENAGLYTYQGFNTALYVNINHKPTVAVPAAPSPSNGGSYHQLGYGFAASSSDADGNALQYYFRIALGSDAETNQVYNSGWQSSASTSWQVPPALWNTTLYWHVYVSDGSWQTNPTYVWSFTAHDSAPNPAAQAGAAPGDKGVVASTTPTLVVPTGTDADSDPVMYNFTISGGSDTPNGRASSGWITTASWPVPPGVLGDGQTYSWSVATNDGTPSAPWLTTAATWSNSLTVNQRLGTSTVSATDTLAGVAVNLANGNASIAAAGHTVSTVGGPVGVGFTYNSQAAVRTGLIGQYYPDPNQTRSFTGLSPTLVRVDPSLNVAWNSGNGTAVSPPGLPVANYLIKWSGYLTVPTTGTYQLGLTNDDGARVFLNNSSTASPNDWAGVTSATSWSSTVTLTAGMATPIEVDYYQVTGPAGLSLFVQGTGSTTLAAQIVPSSWLTPTVSTLPAGWALSLPGGAAGYTHASTSPATGTSAGSVTLTDGEGASHTYLAKTAAATGSVGYTPPVDEDGVLSRAADGTLNLADDDGSFYTFDANGNPSSAQSATDTLHPAAARYSYDTNTTPRVKTVTDPVSGQVITMTYGNSASLGGAACPTPPGGGYAATVAPNLLCQVSYWDGTTTNLYYTNTPTGSMQLAAVLDSVTSPAGAGPSVAQFGYTSGLLTSVESPLAADWVVANALTTAPVTATTVIGYTWINPDTSGSANIRPAFVPATMTGGLYPAGSIPMVTSVTAPTADGTNSTGSLALQPAHTYTYLALNEAQIAVAGLASAVERDVVFDPTSGRTLSDSTATSTSTPALLTASTWAAGGQDLPTSSTDPAGRMSTTVYDWAMRATDTYGPAPAACFSATDPRVPIASPPPSCGVIPHSHTGFDTSTAGARTAGLQTSYWNTTLQSGPPTSRLTATSTAGNFYTNQPAGNAAAGGSEQLSGEIALAPGTDTFSATVADPSNDGVRVFLDGQPVIDRWSTIKQSVLGDAPAQYWRLADPSGTTASNTISGQPAGTATSTILGTAAGPDTSDPGTTAGTFASSAQISVPSAASVPGTALISAEAWIKPTNTGTYQMIVTKDLSNGATSDQFELRLDPGGHLQFLQATSASFYQVTSAATVTFGSAWQHVVATKDNAGTIKLYLNGTLDTGPTFFPAGTTVFPATVPANTEPVLIGAREDGNYFTGQIADVALYPSTLSSTQVAAHYQAGTATLTGTTPITFTAAAPVAPGSLPAAPVSTPHTVRIDYRNPVAAAAFTLKATTGGVTSVVPDSAYDPRYGLGTYHKTDDSGGITSGAEVTATSYTGTNAGTAGTLDPVYGLATDQIIDPAGANLDTKTSYETPGASGYLRPTATALPSSALGTATQDTTLSYYGATQTRDVSTVCPGAPSALINQAGLAEVTTSPTAAGATTVAREVIYDPAGWVAASRVQGDGNNWTCTSMTPAAGPPAPPSQP